MWRAYLTYGDEELTIGDGTSDEFNATEEGVSGWWATPDAKWDLTERSSSDGAFPIDEADIVYSARVVTLELFAEGGERANVNAAKERLLAAAHHECTLRIVDGESDTYVTGYATVEDAGGTVDGRRETMTLTLECPDPRRYGTASETVVLDPSQTSLTGGLSYGEDSTGLAYPLTYGEVEGSGNIATVANGGTSTAYPTIVVYGTFDDGFKVSMSTGGKSYAVEYGNAVTGAPVVLDYGTRTASVGGLDRSRYLTTREFVGIPAGESANLGLYGVGTGWAEATVRDAYV